MTPDLIFGIAVSIIALLVLITLIFAYLGNARGQSTQLIVGMFVSFCALILVAAMFFGEHVRKENNQIILNATKQQDSLTIQIYPYETYDSLLNKNEVLP